MESWIRTTSEPHIRMRGNRDSVGGEGMGDDRSPGLLHKGSLGCEQTSRRVGLTLGSVCLLGQSIYESGGIWEPHFKVGKS